MIHTLEADGIQFGYNERTLLSNIHLKCETGKITGLLGRNGQGKSSLLKVIYGTLTSEKSVRIDNKSEIQVYRKPELVRYLPQFNFIPKTLTLRRIFKNFDIDYSLFSSSFTEFESKYQSKIGNLSGGQVRLVELYVILKGKSEFVILDEPFTHLHPIQIQKVKELFLEEKYRKGLLITDHLFEQVVDVCDSFYLLREGQTILIKDVLELERLGYITAKQIQQIDK